MKKRRFDGEMARSRRGFLKQVGFLAGATVVPQQSFSRFSSLLQSTSSDTEMFAEKMEITIRESLADRPIGEIVVAIGSSFLGTPYAAHTLELPGPEALVVNLRGLDCVTFVENSLALARCVKLRQHDFQEYTKQLQLIRYRGGTIDGYPSRLHYFSDWIYDNVIKGIVRDITKEIGGVPYQKMIDFMSAHREAYRQLEDDAAVEAIRQQETELNSRQRRYIPKEEIESHPRNIEPGDIIAMTTSIEGLDISHTGIAVHMNGVVKYLHAPLAAGVVQISQHSLAEYLLLHKKNTGIIIARPLEPQEKN